MSLIWNVALCLPLPHTAYIVLLEILQLRSSCSMPVCPRRHATRSVCACMSVCVNMFGGLAKRFREKRMCLSKPIQGRSGPSKQQFLHNDLLQWAWKLPQLAAFITHQPQQTGFCFFLFLLLPSAPIWDSSQPFSGHSASWLTSPIKSVRRHRNRRFLAARNEKWCLHCVFATFRPSQTLFTC